MNPSLLTPTLHMLCAPAGCEGKLHRDLVTGSLIVVIGRMHDHSRVMHREFPLIHQRDPCFAVEFIEVVTHLINKLKEDSNGEHRQPGPECKHCLRAHEWCPHPRECAYLQTGKYDPMAPAYIHAAKPRSPEEAWR